MQGDSFQGQIYFRQRLAEPDANPQAFTVRVGEHWVASMTTKEWTRIKLVALKREEMPAPLAVVFPYGLVIGPFNSDWYITAMLHESFHAYQGTLAPERLSAAERATVQEARYPRDDSALQAAWQREVDLLADAVEAESAAEVTRLARELLDQREARRAAHGLGAELVDYERQREWLEGLAEYVELSSWQTAFLSADHRPEPALAADGVFAEYATFEKRREQELAQLRRMVADLRDVTFYYTGWAQCVLLDRLGPGWKSEALDADVFLEALLREAVGGEKERDA